MVKRLNIEKKAIIFRFRTKNNIWSNFSKKIEKKFFLNIFFVKKWLKNGY